MTLRFRRTLRIAPGLRLNLGKRGVSVSAGVRGAGVTLSRQGLYGNVGAPGTGLSYRTRLEAGKVQRGPGSRRAAPSRAGARQIPSALALEADSGQLLALDAEGHPLDDSSLRGHSGAILAELQAAVTALVAEHNRRLDALARLHEGTPAPDAFPECLALPFDVPAPEAPRRPRSIWYLLGRLLLPGYRRITDREWQAQWQEYQDSEQVWARQQALHAAREQRRQQAYASALQGDPAAEEWVLEDHLEDIDWPLPTEASFELRDQGRTLALDVTLPDADSLPGLRLRAYQRGLGISVARLSATARRTLYSQHAHAIGFRLIGEAFAAAPSVERVILSACTVRADELRGGQRDVYLYSVQVNRDVWGDIRFDALTDIDPVASLDQFELRRDMTVTGIFREIEPFGG